MEHFAISNKTIFDALDAAMDCVMEIAELLTDLGLKEALGNSKLAQKCEFALVRGKYAERALSSVVRQIEDAEKYDLSSSKRRSFELQIQSLDIGRILEEVDDFIDIAEPTIDIALEKEKGNEPEIKQLKAVLNRAKKLKAKILVYSR